MKDDPMISDDEADFIKWERAMLTRRIYQELAKEDKASAKNPDLPMGFTPGGKNEPRSHKLNRLRYLLGMPSHVPQVCIDEARDWLSNGNHEYETEIARLFKHDELVTFWRDMFDLLHARYKAMHSKNSEYADYSANRAIREIIIRMTLKGGRPPKENPAPIKERRKEIAKKLLQALKQIEDDEVMKHLTVFELVDMAYAHSEYSPTRTPDFGPGVRGSKLIEQDRIILAEDLPFPGVSYLRLPDILRGLANTIEPGEPLNLNDRIEIPDGMPTSGRSEKEKAKFMLQQYFHALFRRWPDDDCPHLLIAMAINACANPKVRYSNEDSSNAYSNAKQ